MKKSVFLIILILSSLTFGQTDQKKIQMHKSAKNLKQEIEKQIPIGSRINEAQRIMETNGFKCVSKERNSFAEMNEDKLLVEHNNINFLYCDKSKSLLINTRLWQVAVVHQNNNVSDILLSIAKTPVLRRKDYIHMSDSEIRSVFIKYAPLGSSKDEVAKVLRKVFHRDLKKEKNEDISLHYVSLKEHGDFILWSHLQTYDWLNNFFLAASFVESFWIFDKNGILKDVLVVHRWDGV